MGSTFVEVTCSSVELGDPGRIYLGASVRFEARQQTLGELCTLCGRECQNHRKEFVGHEISVAQGPQRGKLRLFAVRLASNSCLNGCKDNRSAMPGAVDNTGIFLGYCSGGAQHDRLTP